MSEEPGKIELKRDGGMPEAVKQMIDYWKTYPLQHGYKDYTAGIFLDDALYSIGIALNPARYGFASGYAQFKSDLLAALEHTTEEKA